MSSGAIRGKRRTRRSCREAPGRRGPMTGDKSSRRVLERRMRALEKLAGGATTRPRKTPRLCPNARTRVGNGCGTMPTPCEGLGGVDAPSDCCGPCEGKCMAKAVRHFIARAREGAEDGFGRGDESLPCASEVPAVQPCDVPMGGCGSIRCGGLACGDGSFRRTRKVRCVRPLCGAHPRLYPRGRSSGLRIRRGTHPLFERFRSVPPVLTDTHTHTH